MRAVRLRDQHGLQHPGTFSVLTERRGRWLAKHSNLEQDHEP
jgi:hypothetical protein